LLSGNDDTCAEIMAAHLSQGAQSIFIKFLIDFAP
jgi:hypothetical protein